MQLEIILTAEIKNGYDYFSREMRWILGHIRRILLIKQKRQNGFLPQASNLGIYCVVCLSLSWVHTTFIKN